MEATAAAAAPPAVDLAELLPSLQQAVYALGEAVASVADDPTDVHVSPRVRRARRRRRAARGESRRCRRRVARSGGAAAAARRCCC